MLLCEASSRLHGGSRAQPAGGHGAICARWHRAGVRFLPRAARMELGTRAHGLACHGELTPASGWRNLL